MRFINKMINATGGTITEIIIDVTYPYVVQCTPDICYFFIYFV